MSTGTNSNFDQNLIDDLNILECRNIFVNYIANDTDIKEMIIDWLRNPSRYASQTILPNLNQQQLSYLADQLMQCNVTDYLSFLRQLKSVHGDTLSWIHSFMISIKDTFKSNCTCCQ